MYPYHYSDYHRRKKWGKITTFHKEVFKNAIVQSLLAYMHPMSIALILPLSYKGIHPAEESQIGLNAHPGLHC